MERFLTPLVLVFARCLFFEVSLCHVTEFQLEEIEGIEHTADAIPSGMAGADYGDNA